MYVYYVEMEEVMGIYDSWEKAEDALKDYCEVEEVAKIELVSACPTLKTYKMIAKKWYEDDEDSWDWCYIAKLELNKKFTN